MENIAERKLSKATGLSDQIVKKLVEAGYRSPGRIRDATNTQLRAIPGIERAQLEAIREVLPKR